MARHTIGFLIRSATVAWLAFATAHAAEFPARPVKMIVPLSAGTTTDVVARTFAERLSQKLGEPFTVENKPGAGGTVAARYVASSAPNGYTILLVNSQHTINPAIYKSLPYDTLRDFAGLALVAEAPAAVVVCPQLGIHTLADFIALAKQRPGSIYYASSGIGSQTHLAGAEFASKAGITMTHVPYQNASQVITDMMAGRAQAVFVPLAFLLGQIEDGKLVALAVTSRHAIRAPVALPAVSETIPGYEYSTWFGFVSPAKTPRPVMEELAHAMADVAGDDAVKEKLTALGILPRTMLLEDFDQYIKTDLEKEKHIADAAGVKPQ